MKKAFLWAMFPGPMAFLTIGLFGLTAAGQIKEAVIGVAVIGWAVICLSD